MPRIFPSPKRIFGRITGGSPMARPAVSAVLGGVVLGEELQRGHRRRHQAHLAGAATGQRIGRADPLAGVGLAVVVGVRLLGR